MKFESTRDLLNQIQNTASVDPFQLNTEGYRLVEAGEIDEGMRMLEQSASFGVPWAAATYTWQKMKQGKPQEAIDFYYKVEDVVTRETKANSNHDVWREQFVNLRCNVALARLAVGGDESLAIQWWEEGAKEKHPESLFYPAILASRNGNRWRAVRIASEFPKDLRSDLASTLDDVYAFDLPWFKEWASEGQSVLLEAITSSD